MLWQIYVHPRTGQPDTEGRRVADELNELGIGLVREVRSARGYLLEGELRRGDVERIGRELLADPVIEDFSINDEGDQPRAAPGDTTHHSPLTTHQYVIATVLLKPGVMDPVAQSVEQAIAQLGLRVEHVRTLRRYWIAGPDGEGVRQRIAERLANDAIEQVVWGALKLERLEHGTPYRFQLVRLPIRTMTDSELERTSRDGQLSLSLVEMQTIQQHFRELGRDPTDAELETLAQTWSEHCSHKTLRGRIDYEELDADGQVVRREHFDNLLKETIFHATDEIRRRLGPDDWCVSVFEDNAGVVRFDEQYNVCFKVETHNHPSAIEPYGGANTGIGGVIRDVLGTGLAAKPIANTDVFCFAPPDWGQESEVRGQGSEVRGQESDSSGSPLTTHHSPLTSLPPGVLHPKRVMKGVVAGVRDYGNRMGIPTVNGAIYFDERYLGNPLVFCGTVGLIPRDRSHKQPQPGDLIVAVGGRTGRDGIHGATFSSAELTHESDELSGGAVQIGNAITEKMMLDVILAARDRGLYHAITDCGAGGFSSAVGEMGADIGAEVWLERVPLKYAGLSYTEIWISEAQERMVLAMPEMNWPEFQRLAASEGVEATVIGRFEPTGRLLLKYDGHVVGDLDMSLLHKGRPPLVRRAVYAAVGSRQSAVGQSDASSRPTVTTADCRLPTADSSEPSYNDVLRHILSSWNVCSKEWVIRQYDHEVQGGSVIKPLVGAANDGPSDAAVIRPVLGSNRGLAIACGMNPRYGDLDPYWMAVSAIDEAIRNCVAVGADPDRIAILDNFCWGNTDRPEELGKLVRAALACRDLAIAYGTPFISGKDSLNNEFATKADGRQPKAESRVSDIKSESSDGRRIVIPPTLLISAIGQIDDVRQCVTMDLKEPGNILYLVGSSERYLGGSHFELVAGRRGGEVPKINVELARRMFRAIHDAIQEGLIRSCHDLSEGGLAVALAEMCIAANLGAKIDLHAQLVDLLDQWAWFQKWSGTVVGSTIQDITRMEGADVLYPPPDFSALVEGRIERLFGETNFTFVLEVPADRKDEYDEFLDDRLLKHFPHELYCQDIGKVTDTPVLVIEDYDISPAPRPRKRKRRRSGLQTVVRLSVEELKECWQRPLRW
jgi:phosphoribosylformylglycinamidine synthase